MTGTWETQPEAKRRAGRRLSHPGEKMGLEEDFSEPGLHHQADKGSPKKQWEGGRKAKASCS